MKTAKSSSKRAPQRTCLACHKTADKRGLIRLVRQADGRVMVDARGRLAGRGAYLCRDEACWQAGLSGKQLEHALKVNMTEKDLAQLKSAVAGLTGDS